MEKTNDHQRPDGHETGETTGHEFVITRVLNAPRDLVWKVYTEAEHLVHWWGPRNFKMYAIAFEFRPGGVFHFGMESPDGYRMWARFVYQEIVKPERIVFINSFSDEQGHIIRYPHVPTWPLETLNTLTFAADGDRTVVTLKGNPLNATTEERKTFEDGFGSMQQGFNSSFDQLEIYLKNYNLNNI